MTQLSASDPSLLRHPKTTKIKAFTAIVDYLTRHLPARGLSHCRQAGYVASL